MSQLKRNLIYNILYQLLIIILPLITVPYISRILGAEGIGIYSYTYSIIYYFMLASMIGINNYGNRVIAKVRENRKELSKSFLSIYFIQIFMTFIMIILYLIYITFFDNKYLTIAIIQILFLISCFFDTNWFFFGLEKFRITVVRNIIIKIISLVLIFILVKNGNDLWIYTIIMGLSVLLSQLVLIPFLIKEINLVKISKKDIIVHLKPCFTLFIPVIAISLYKIMDKIMIGAMSTMVEVGIYEQAEKIINIPLSLIAALGNVMLPRISNLVSKGKNEKIELYIKKSISFIMFLAFPICFGLISISKTFIPIFLGSDFNKSVIIVYYLSFTVLFISFANIIRTQFLLPKEKDKLYITSVIIGAIINLSINYLLIPHYKSIGAAIGTIVAEFLVMFIQVFFIRKELPIKQYIIDIIPFLLKSLIMLLFVYSINYLKITALIKIIIQIIIGCSVYSILNLNYIKTIIDFKMVLKTLKKRLIKQ